MSLFSGKCVGGPWDKQLLRTHSNYVRVPIRRSSQFLGPLKTAPAFEAADYGIYQFVGDKSGIGEWTWKAKPA